MHSECIPGKGLATHVYIRVILTDWSMLATDGEEICVATNGHIMVLYTQ